MRLLHCCKTVAAAGISAVFGQFRAKTGKMCRNQNLFGWEEIMISRFKRLTFRCVQNRRKSPLQMLGRPYGYDQLWIILGWPCHYSDFDKLVGILNELDLSNVIGEVYRNRKFTVHQWDWHFVSPDKTAPASRFSQNSTFSHWNALPVGEIRLETNLQKILEAPRPANAKAYIDDSVTFPDRTFRLSRSKSIQNIRLRCVTDVDLLTKTIAEHKPGLVVYRAVTRTMRTSTLHWILQAWGLGRMDRKGVLVADPLNCLEDVALLALSSLL